MERRSDEWSCGAGSSKGETPAQVDDLHAAAARGLWDHHGARAHPGGGQGEVPGEGEEL